MNNPSVLFSGLVTALLGVIFLLLAFETWALFSGQRPISDYVHATVHAYPGPAFVVAVVIGMLIGHVLWGPPGALGVRQGRSL